MGGNLRKTYIDMAKGIGILLVIYGHCASGANVFVSWQCTFFMPLFFICSGLCYTKPKSIKQNASKILMPYYTWGGVGFVLEICLAILSRTATVYVAVESLVEYLLGMSMWNYPLWFLGAFFVCKYLFDWMMSMRLGKNTKLWHCFLAVGAFIAGVFLGWVRGRYAFFFPFRADIGLSMILFMLVGLYSKQLIERAESIPSIKKVLVACLLLAINLVCFRYNTLVSVNSSEYGNPLLFFVGAVSGSYFVIILCQTINGLSLVQRPLSFLGQNSSTIMCTHAIVLLFAAKLIITVNRFVGFSTTMVDLAKFICCTFAVVAVCLLLNRIKRRKGTE